IRRRAFHRDGLAGRATGRDRLRLSSMGGLLGQLGGIRHRDDPGDVDRLDLRESMADSRFRLAAPRPGKPLALPGPAPRSPFRLEIAADSKGLARTREAGT